MKIWSKVALGFIGFIIILFGLNLAGIEWYKFFETKRQNAERQIYKATKSYNEAVVQDLAKYRMEYLKAEDKSSKKLIVETIRMRFPNLDPKRIENPTLKQFYKTIIK